VGKELLRISAGTLVIMIDAFLGSLPRIRRRYSDRIQAEKAMVRFPAGVSDLSLLHSIQIDPGAHPDSYSMGIGGYIPRDKAAMQRI
jgi:hypothetical protein